MQIKTFSEALNYIDSLIRQTKTPYKKPKLERITELLERLGNPHKQIKTIHIGGTAGKTSTSYMVADILQHAGFKTGLHISPHLEDIRERMQINSALMPKDRFTRMVEALKPVVEAMTKESEWGKPSYFETSLALAFQYFAQEKVDIAVIEVGLGGTLDGTNVIVPEVAVLTNVGLDHTEILGDTVEKIASDKVGIFKQGIPVVSGVSQPSVLKIIEERAQLLHCPLTLLHRDVIYTIAKQTIDGTQFSYQSHDLTLEGIQLKPLGEHQVQNASLAITIARILNDRGLSINEQAIRQSLASLTVPGRFEIFQRPATDYQRPTIILDGAHNPDKINALTKLLQALFPKKKFRFVFGVKKDKNRAKMIQTLSPTAKKFYFTNYTKLNDFGLATSVNPSELQALTPVDSAVAQNNIDAIRQAWSEVQTNDVIVVTGSLYLVGEVRSSVALQKIKKLSY